MKKYAVTALGELLIDFTENGQSGQGNPVFEANPGGAPCNVLAMLARLGHKTAFIGKVGNDFFGEMLRDTIVEMGIDASALCIDEHIHTTLALIHNAPDGERDFSFDPNLRPPLWESLEEARKQVLYGLEHCHILKISDNEIQWLTGKEDYTEGVGWINERYHIPLILVSMGREGSRAYYKEKMIEALPFLQENTMETTGAGDTFCGCVLHYICEHGLENLTEENLQEMLMFANAAASLITTRKGALRVMPEKEEIEKLIEERRAIANDRI